MSLSVDKKAIYFKKECEIEALIYAPNGTIQFDKSAIVIGGVVAESINVKMDSSFTYIPAASTIDLPGGFPATLIVRSHTIN